MQTAERVGHAIDDWERVDEESLQDEDAAGLLESLQRDRDRLRAEMLEFHVPRLRDRRAFARRSAALHAWDAAWRLVDANDVVELGRRPALGRRGVRSWIGAPMLARGLDAWPRSVQILSVGATFSAAILTAGRVLAPAIGLAVAFFSLAALFFGNYAAWRRDQPHWIVGPGVAVLGTWGCLIITAAIAVNAAVG